MEIKEQEVEGVFEIYLKPMEDDRGFFMRVFDETLFENAGINRKWVQENHSKSLPAPLHPDTRKPLLLDPSYS